MKRFLDYTGARRFKENIEQMVKNMVGISDSDSELAYASNADIDDGVFDDKEAGDGVITLHNMSYYHKKLKNNTAKDISTSGTELNKSVLDTVADALVLKTDESDEVKTEIYENVETIIDSKMKWKESYPDTI